MEERQHALLGASSAHRWMKCPASARLEDLLEDNDTKYSEEGTLAHALAEKVLSMNKEETVDFPNEEMKENVGKYVAYVMSKFEELKVKDSLAIRHHEVRLDFSNFVPDGFGTGDTVIIALGELHVMDLKYGAGIKVSAIDNPQLMLYGLGALNAYDFLFDIKKVVLHIIQPRLDSISTFEITPEDLVAWGEKVKESAKKAFSGEGDALPGEHCQFCKVSGICRARAKVMESMIEVGKDFKLLSKDELLPVYEKCLIAEKYIKDINAYILNTLSGGEKIPGLKLVEGRSTSRYSDQTTVEDYLVKELGYEDALIHKPRELITLTDLKKLIKKDYAKLEENGMLVKNAGKPTVALASDKRPEMDLKSNLINDFEEIK